MKRYEHSEVQTRSEHLFVHTFTKRIVISLPYQGNLYRQAEKIVPLKYILVTVILCEIFC